MANKRKLDRLSGYVIGIDDVLSYGGTFFRLAGEREGLWHRLARPADLRAHNCLRDRYGRMITTVAGRPDWGFPHLFGASETRMVRLIDGPLHTALAAGLREPAVEQVWDTIYSTSEGHWVAKYVLIPGTHTARFHSEESFEF